MKFRVERDALAEVDLLIPAVDALGARAKLILIAGADHAFHVPAKSGRRDSDVLVEILDSASQWMHALAA